MTTQNGFSLLEASAVLGVLAVLTSLTIPFAAATQRATQQLEFVDEFTRLLDQSATRDCGFDFSEVRLPASKPQYRITRSCRGHYWTLCATNEGSGKAQVLRCIDRAGRRFIDSDGDHRFTPGTDPPWTGI